MLIPSQTRDAIVTGASLSRRVNANSQQRDVRDAVAVKLIKKGEC